MLAKDEFVWKAMGREMSSMLLTYAFNDVDVRMGGFSAGLQVFPIRGRMFRGRRFAWHFSFIIGYHVLLVCNESMPLSSVRAFALYDRLSTYCNGNGVV